ncbi:MAG: hypothetical protein IJA72_04065, partial [Clostridia bacterium]|nr:hypothetical protein [Clostridia bacterium]
MRLGKSVKFNMIIAILLCMAFVVNIGHTLAATTYSLLVSSSVDATNKETYIEYANASGSTGKYYYSTGSYNNQLNISYGFS